MAGTKTESVNGLEPVEVRDVLTELLAVHESLRTQRKSFAEWLGEAPLGLREEKELVRTQLLPEFWQSIHKIVLAVAANGREAVSTSNAKACTTSTGQTPNSVQRSHRQATNPSTTRKRDPPPPGPNSGARSHPSSGGRRQRSNKVIDTHSQPPRNASHAPSSRGRPRHQSPGIQQTSSWHASPQAQPNVSSMDEFPSLSSTPVTSPVGQGRAASDKKRRIKPTSLVGKVGAGTAPASPHVQPNPGNAGHDINPVFTSTPELECRIKSASSAAASLAKESVVSVPSPTVRGGGGTDSAWKQSGQGTSQDSSANTSQVSSLNESDASLQPSVCNASGQQMQSGMTSPEAISPSAALPSSSVDAVDDLASLARRLSFGVSSHAEPATDVTTSALSAAHLLSSVKEFLSRVSDLYVACIEDGIAPNVFSEIHLLVHLLSIRQSVASVSSKADGAMNDLNQALVSANGVAYFVVRCLAGLSSYLLLVDDNSRRLLASHAKVSLHAPELAATLSQSLEKAREDGFQKLDLRAVPFQEDRDGVAFFPSQKTYHSFKKQRGVFCSLLREWEEAEEIGHTMSVEGDMGGQIRELLDMQLTNLVHFVRYFVLLLMQSSQADSAGLLDGMTEADASVLRTAGSDKLHLLQQKLVESSINRGSCPGPSFPGDQEFFRGFIVAGQTCPAFFFHLQGCLSDKIVELHGKEVLVLQSEMNLQGSSMRLVQQLVVLGKFLGFSMALPAGNQDSIPPTLEPTWHKFIEWWPAPPVDLRGMVESSLREGVLCLTLPWIVHMFAALGRLSLHANCFKPVWALLIVIKRKVHLAPPCAARSYLLVLLGWLFELLNVAPASIAYPPELNQLRVDLSASTQQSSALAHLINASFTSSVCPFVNEIGRTLSTSVSEFVSSSSRRITAVLCAQKPEVHPQDSLAENFLAYQAPIVRQVVNIVVERFVSRVKKEVCSVVLPSLMETYRDQITDFLHENRGVLAFDIRSEEAQAKVQYFAGQLITDLSQRMAPLVARYSEGDCYTAVSLLLDSEVPQSVVGAARALAGRRIRQQLLKWQDSEMAGIVSQAVHSCMEKCRHVAVSMVGPALKELEAGVVQDQSWSYRPVEDVLKILDRRIEAAAYRTVLDVVPLSVLEENVRAVQALLQSGSRTMAVCSSDEIFPPSLGVEMLKEKRLKSIGKHSCQLAIACFLQHATQCSHGCVASPGTDAEVMTMDTMCTGLAGLQSALTSLCCCLQDSFKLVLPPPDFPKKDCQLFQSIILPSSSLV